MKGGGNAWTDHIHDFAKRNNMTYMCALSNAKCKEEYHGKKPKKVKKGRLAEKEQMGMEDIDAPVDKKKQVKFKKAVLAKKLEKETEKKETEQMGMEDINVVLFKPKKKVEVAKKSRGRPKKYQTKEEADKAKHDNTVKAFKRRQEEKRQAKKEAKENKMMAQEDKPKKRGRPKKTGAGSGVSTARRPTTPVAEPVNFPAPVVAENVEVRPSTAELAEMPRAVANVQGVEPPILAEARANLEVAQSSLAELVRQGLITPQRRALVEAEIARNYIILNNRSRRGRGRPRKAKKGGAVADWENSIKKIGNSLGKPFEAVTYLNPFDLGYSLGHDVIGPALFGSGADPRDKDTGGDDDALITREEAAEQMENERINGLIRLANDLTHSLSALLEERRELEGSLRLFRERSNITELNLNGRMAPRDAFVQELQRLNNINTDLRAELDGIHRQLAALGIYPRPPPIQPLPSLQGTGRTARVADIRNLKFLKDRRKALLEERQRHFDMGHFGGDPSVDSINAELDAIGSMGSSDVPTIRTPRRHITTRGVYSPEELYLGSVLDDSSSSGSEWSGEGFASNIYASSSDANRLRYPAQYNRSFTRSGSRMTGGMTENDALALGLPFAAAGGLFALNKLYNFAYNLIMRNQPVPIPVVQAIRRNRVPRDVPRAVATLVQQELVPAHYAVYPAEMSVPLSDVEVRDVETGRGMSGGMTAKQIHTNLMSNGWYRDLPDDEKLVVWRTVENVVKDLDGDVRSMGGINKIVESVRKVLNIAVPSVSQNPFENDERPNDREYFGDFLKEMEGEGQSKSKVVPAGKTKKVAPAPEEDEYLPRISPGMIQRQEQRRMVMEDPLIQHQDAQMSELRKMLEGLAPKKPEGKGKKGGLKLTKKSVLEHYGNIVNHLVSHITDPKEPVDKRDYSQSINVIKEIKKIKGKK